MRRLGWLLGCIGLLMLVSACAPAVTSANFEYAPLSATTAQAMVQGFAPTLEGLAINLERGSETALRYAGSDQQAFLAIIDRFYQQNPGFCPLERGGFHSDTSGKVFLTIAAKGLEVRGFVYDLSARPRIDFALFAGSSAVVLKTQACRTVGSK